MRWPTGSCSYFTVGNPKSFISSSMSSSNSSNGSTIAHSFLFCGPRGVGKTTCARIFAKEINQFNNEVNVDDLKDIAFFDGKNHPMDQKK